MNTLGKFVPCRIRCGGQVRQLRLFQEIRQLCALITRRETDSRHLIHWAAIASSYLFYSLSYSSCQFARNNISSEDPVVVDYRVEEYFIP